MSLINNFKYKNCSIAHQDISVNGHIQTRSYLITPKKRKGHIIYGSGFSADPLENVHTFEKLRRHGFSTHAICLPHPGKVEYNPKIHKEYFAPYYEDDFLDDYSELIAYVCSQQNPVTPDDGTPIYILGHSTFNLMILKNIFEGKMEFPDNVRHIYMMAPFMDSSGSSKRYGRLADIFHKAYVHHFVNDKLVGDNWIDRKWLDYKGGKGYADELIKAQNYHRHVAKIRYLAQETTDKTIHSDGLPHNINIPDITFILGSNDPLACTPTAKDVARAIKANIREYDAGHTPVHQCDQAFEDFFMSVNVDIRHHNLERHLAELSNYPSEQNMCIA